MSSPALGPYVLLDELGRGSFGSVHLAEHQGLLRKFALKVVRADGLDEEARARFLREARLASRFSDPCVVGVFDVGEERGFLYYAMEHCRGPTLRERLREGRLQPREAALLVSELARGVQALHDHGVIHRDLKPANIILEEGTGRPRLTDFGMAHEGQAQSLTRTGDVLGTPYYMSPEQLRGERVDGRADVYALGVVLYECLSGALPYQASSMYELSEKILQGPLAPPLRRLDPALPAELESICTQAMARDRDRRTPSARSIQEQLESFLGVSGSQSSWEGASAPPALAPGPPRWLAPVLAVALGCGGAVAVIAWLSGGSVRYAPAPAPESPAGAATQAEDQLRLHRKLEEADALAKLTGDGARRGLRERLEEAARLAAGDPAQTREVGEARRRLARERLERGRLLSRESADDERILAELDLARWLAGDQPPAEEIEALRRPCALRAALARSRALDRQGAPHEDVERELQVALSAAVSPGERVGVALAQFEFLARRRLGAERVAAALEVARAAAAGDPQLLASVTLARAQQAYASGRFSECVELVSLVPSAGRPGLEALSLQAYCAMEEGRGEEAVRILQRVASRDSDGVMGLSASAQIGLLTGDGERCLSAGRAALELEPDHVSALVAMGWILLSRRESEEAKVNFTRARDLAPQRWDTHWALALSDFLQGRIQESYQPLGEVLELTASQPYWPAYFYRARVFLNQRPHGNWQSVVDRYEQARPGHPGIHVLRGYALWLNGMHGLAKKEWLQAVRADEKLAWLAAQYLAPKGSRAMAEAVQGVSRPPFGSR